MGGALAHHLHSVALHIDSVQYMNVREAVARQQGVRAGIRLACWLTEHSPKWGIGIDYFCLLLSCVLHKVGKDPIQIQIPSQVWKWKPICDSAPLVGCWSASPFFCPAAE